MQSTEDSPGPINNMDDSEKERLLLERIGQRRSAIARFLARARPRNSRLALLSLVSSTCSAALAVGPGVGGDSFNETVQDLFGLDAASVVWQVLCLAATAMAVVSAFCARALRAKELTGHISEAESADIQLDSLVTMLEFDKVDVDTAVDLYQDYSKRIAFVPIEPSSD